jgi:hypothetical protein
MTDGDDAAGGGFGVDDAYRVLAGLPPLEDEPAHEPTGYSRENAYRILRGLRPLPEPPGDRA